MLTNSRTIGVMAHVDAGKTTVSERMLVYAGRLRHAGDIDAGNTHLDTMPEERAKGITISAAATSFEWVPRVGLGEGVRHRVQLVDTPGHVDFGIEVERALSVLDGAVLVLDAHKGVEPQTEAVWRQAKRHGVPRIGFVNKMDKPGADWLRCLDSVRDRLGAEPLPVAWPVGAGSTFDAVVDLRTGEALRFSGADGRVVTVVPVPDALGAVVAEARAALHERLADYDDEVLDAFVAGAQPSVVALDRALRRVVLAGAYLPVLPGAALQDKGVQPLLDGVVQWLPSPVDRPPFSALSEDGSAVTVTPDPEGALVALVFKTVVDKFIGALAWTRVLCGQLSRGDTVELGSGRRSRVGRLLRLDGANLEDVEVARVGDVVAVAGLGDTRTGESLCAVGHVVRFGSLRVPEPVIEVAVEAASRSDQERVNAALRRYAVEDPSLGLGIDPESGQTLVRGQGELHLEVLLAKARREVGVEMRSSAPRVAWRETPARAARTRFRHIRQNGGSGTFAVVEMTVEPGPPGSGFVFANESVGGALPAAYVAAVEKGAREAAGSGIDAPVTDVRVVVHDGETHAKDSSAMAFEQAGSLAFNEALVSAGSVLLEPRVSVDVTVPEHALGSVLGDLAGRGATIRDLATGADVVVHAEAPLRRMFGYVATLRGLTQGRGSFAMEPAGYAPATSDALAARRAV
jgi:elongation factor G